MRLASIVAFVLLALCAARPAAAQEGPATRALRERTDELVRAMRRRVSTDAERTRRQEEVARIVGELFDYDDVAQRSLAPEQWSQGTPEQRRRFTELLRRNVERNYQANLERILDYEVRYVSESATADGVLVTTEARSRTERRQPPIAIVYEMRLVDGHWRVAEVTTERAPMIGTYRRNFTRIVVREGWDALLRRLEERLAQPIP